MNLDESTILLPLLGCMSSGLVLRGGLVAGVLCLRTAGFLIFSGSGLSRAAPPVRSTVSGASKHAENHG